MGTVASVPMRNARMARRTQPNLGGIPMLHDYLSITVHDPILNNGFTLIPNAVLESDISSGAKVTYALLLKHAGQKREIEMNCTSEELETYFAELHNSGLISWDQSRNICINDLGEFLKQKPVVEQGKKQLGKKRPPKKRPPKEDIPSEMIEVPSELYPEPISHGQAAEVPAISNGELITVLGDALRNAWAGPPAKAYAIAGRLYHLYDFPAAEAAISSFAWQIKSGHSIKNPVPYLMGVARKKMQEFSGKEDEPVVSKRLFSEQHPEDHEQRMSQIRDRYSEHEQFLQELSRESRRYREVPGFISIHNEGGQDSGSSTGKKETNPL
jgi:hypothetical protein